MNTACAGIGTGANSCCWSCCGCCCCCCCCCCGCGCGCGCCCSCCCCCCCGVHHCGCGGDGVDRHCCCRSFGVCGGDAGGRHCCCAGGGGCTRTPRACCAFRCNTGRGLERYSAGRATLTLCRGPAAARDVLLQVAVCEAGARQASSTLGSLNEELGVKVDAVESCQEWPAALDSQLQDELAEDWRE